MAARKRGRGGRQEESINLDATISVDPEATKAIEALADTLVSAISKRLDDLTKQVRQSSATKGSPLGEIGRKSRDKEELFKNFERYYEMQRRHAREGFRETRAAQREHAADMNNLRQQNRQRGQDAWTERALFSSYEKEKERAGRLQVQTLSTQRAQITAEKERTKAEARRQVEASKAARAAATEEARNARAASRARTTMFNQVARADPERAMQIAESPEEQNIARARATRADRTIHAWGVKSLLRRAPERVLEMSDEELRAGGVEPTAARIEAQDRINSKAGKGKHVRRGLAIFAARQIFSQARTAFSGAMGGSFSGALGGGGGVIGGILGAIGGAPGALIGSSIGNAIGGVVGGIGDASVGAGQRGLGYDRMFQQIALSSGSSTQAAAVRGAFLNPAGIPGGMGIGVLDALAPSYRADLKKIGLSRADILSTYHAMQKRPGLSNIRSSGEDIATATKLQHILGVNPDALGALLAPGSSVWRGGQPRNVGATFDRMSLALFGDRPYTVGSMRSLYETAGQFALQAQSGGLPFSLDAFNKNIQTFRGQGMSGLRQAAGASAYAQSLGAAGPQDMVDAYAMLYGTGLAEKGKISSGHLLLAMSRLQEGSIDMDAIRKRFMGDTADSRLIYDLLFRNKFGGGVGTLNFITPTPPAGTDSGLTANSSSTNRLELPTAETTAKAAETELSTSLQSAQLSANVQLTVARLITAFNKLIPVLERFTEQR